MSMVKIRFYNKKGSEVKEYSVIDEAQKLIDSYWEKECAIVDESTDTIIEKDSKIVDNKTYGILHPIVGGG